SALSRRGTSDEEDGRYHDRVVPLGGSASPLTPPSRRATAPSDQPRMTIPREAFKSTQAVEESGKIIGTRVKRPQGEDLGENQLLMAPKEGKVATAVIGLGGVVGIGEKHVVGLAASRKRRHPDVPAGVRRGMILLRRLPTGWVAALRKSLPV